MESNSNSSISVDIPSYLGPLETLLDLAKNQKVDLTKISITTLADHFLGYIKESKNLDLAFEYLIMATWLAYLKSKLLLPEDEEDNFKASEIAEKLKLQLKKLELIRLLSDQLLKRDRIGKNIFYRGMKGGIRTSINSNYSVSLYELLKSYSNHIMKKNFLSINIPKLPVFTTEQGIDILNRNLSKLKDWKNLYEIIPSKFKTSTNLKKTGISGIFAASLELTREGANSIMQKKSFERLLIKEKK